MAEPRKTSRKRQVVQFQLTPVDRAQLQQIAAEMGLPTLSSALRFLIHRTYRNLGEKGDFVRT